MTGTRSRILALALVAVAALSAAGGFLLAGANGQAPKVTVYKTPTCGCCTAWVEYIENAGFRVEAHDVQQAELNALKQEQGMEWNLASCHTAFVDGYVVEGHVPATEIRRLLDERPDVAGITVPGMPVGSPGMEIGDRQDPYDVLTFDGEGNTAIFASY